MYDSHLHSCISFDSNLKHDDICNFYIANNFKGICFTEHNDYRIGANKDYDLTFDRSQYLQEFARVKEKFADKLELRRGVEVGLQKHNVELNKKLIEEFKPDFVIGSIHNVEGEDIFDGDFTSRRKRLEAYLEYLNYQLNCVKLHDCFNVLGHMDMVLRRQDYEPRDFHEAELHLLVDDILRELIAKGKGIEVNTSGFRYNLPHFHPNFWIIERYKNLGGEIITCGSDGHRMDTIGEGIPRAYRALKEIGFDYISFFVEGKETKRKIEI